MKKIELIKEDFWDINVSTSKYGGNSQFIQPEGCPIFNACKRQSIDVIRVSPYRIKTNSSPIYIKGSLNDVERCRKRLLEGKKAFIEIISE